VVLQSPPHRRPRLQKTRPASEQEVQKSVGKCGMLKESRIEKKDRKNDRLFIARHKEKEIGKRASNNANKGRAGWW